VASLLMKQCAEVLKCSSWVEVASLQLREPTPYKTLHYINCFAYLLFLACDCMPPNFPYTRKSTVLSWATWAHRVPLISVSIALSQTPAYTERDHGYGSSISRGVSAYSPAFAGTQFLPTPEGWPGWVKLGVWLKYQDCANATVTRKQLLIPL